MIHKRILVLVSLFCALLLVVLGAASPAQPARAAPLPGYSEGFGCDAGGGSGFALRIVVHDPDGNPVAGANCRWTQEQCRSDGCSLQMRAGQTNAQGEWSTDHCVDCSREWSVLVNKGWDWEGYSGTFGAGAAANGGTCTLHVVFTRPERATPTPPPAGPPEQDTRNPDLELFYRPANPVVVGQDPERRGVDICLRARSHPVIRTTYTIEWDEEQEEWVQVPHTTVVPDPIDLGSIRIQAALTDQSIQWITGVLAQRYPGLTVHQAAWTIAPDANWQVSGQLQADGSYTVTGCNARLPFDDPGRYRVRASFATHGTAWTEPAGASAEIVVPDAFLGVALVD